MAKGGVNPAAGQYGVNPMNNAAQGMSEAFNAQSGALNASNSFYGSQGAGQYDANTQANPNTIQSGMGSYQNQYNNDVVDTTTAQMNQNLAMQQNATGADASRAGAFGGARHGIVEATNASQTNDAIGRMTAQQQQQGFRDAANMSGQDINNRMNVGAQNQGAMNAAGQFNAGQSGNMVQQGFSNATQAAQGMGSLAGQSYGMGSDINAQQMQAGGMAQQLNQMLLNNGSGMYDQWANQPTTMLNQRLAALGQNPMNNSGTQTSTQSIDPGWGATAGNLIGAAGSAFRFNPITFGG